MKQKLAGRITTSFGMVTGHGYVSSSRTSRNLIYQWTSVTCNQKVLGNRLVAGMSRILGAQAGSCYDKLHSPRFWRYRSPTATIFHPNLNSSTIGECTPLPDWPCVCIITFLENQGFWHQYNVMPAGYEGESFAVGYFVRQIRHWSKINQGFRNLKNGEFQRFLTNGLVKMLPPTKVEK